MEIKYSSTEYDKNHPEKNYYDNELNRKHHKRHHKRKDHDRHHKKHQNKDYEVILDNEHNIKNDKKHREHNSHRHRERHDKKHYSGKNYLWNHYYKKFLVFENDKIVEYIEPNRNYYNNQNKKYIEDNSVHTPNLLESDLNHNQQCNENHILLENVNTEQIIPSNKNKIAVENCETTVTSEMLPLCENIPYISKAIKGPVTIKVPVVLAECKVIITVQSSLKLQDTVSEIKDIGKNVYLNQFKFTPSFESHKYNTGIVFIDGFIKKNIEYISKEQVKGEILKYSSAKIPFKCATKIPLKTPPKFTPTPSQNKIDISETDVKICGISEKDSIAQNAHEQNFKLIQPFNESVFCQLINSEIVETDILEHPKNQDRKSSLNKDSHKITEKVVLLLTIKLLQNQYVEISP
ncbi:conserved hypothetical protein [Clostridiaceae bacterium BL-3]|nr:conserved hypothetical protein [Clostridiaceae bacterium BL-3]